MSAVNTLPQSIRFQDTDLSIIDYNGLPWLTGPQIVDALKMSGRQGVNNIYQRNADEFTTDMTAVVSRGRARVRIFSPRGCHLIAMFARTERAKAFRRWVLDVLDGLVQVRASSRQDGLWATTIGTDGMHVLRKHLTPPHHGRSVTSVTAQSVAGFASPLQQALTAPFHGRGFFMVGRNGEPSRLAGSCCRSCNPLSPGRSFARGFPGQPTNRRPL